MKNKTIYETIQLYARMIATDAQEIEEVNPTQSVDDIDRLCCMSEGIGVYAKTIFQLLAELANELEEEAEGE